MCDSKLSNTFREKDHEKVKFEELMYKSSLRELESLKELNTSINKL